MSMSVLNLGREYHLQTNIMFIYACHSALINLKMDIEILMQRWLSWCPVEAILKYSEVDGAIRKLLRALSRVSNLFSVEDYYGDPWTLCVSRQTSLLIMRKLWSLIVKTYRSFFRSLCHNSHPEMKFPVLREIVLQL